MTDGKLIFARLCLGARNPFRNFVDSNSLRMKNIPVLLNRYFLAVVFVLLLIPFGGKAQTYSDYVTWTTSSKKISDCEYEVILTATIKENWHIYSQKEFKDGPLPTVFKFKSSADYKLIGKTSEPKGHIDPSWKELEGFEVPMFEKSAEFRQKVQLLTDKEVTISGTIGGQVCQTSCVEAFPPIKFSIKLTGKSCGAAADTSTKVTPGTTTVGAADTAKRGKDSVAKATPATVPPAGTNNTSGGATLKKTESSVWGAFGGGFAGGLIALITPCVFPMIPMTVSFFTKRTKNRSKGIRDALIYALSIVGIYVLLGLVVTLATGNAQALNQLSANIWLNLIFFAIFIVFGISFLGAFEITMPSRFVNKVDRASDKGGLIGIFFMAFTLSLVSFSCTGPIVGSALVEAVHVGIKGPLFVMLGFSIALALPFALFAMFPGWLSSLPKSGGWLNSVKVVMGLLEFALALKFLSNVDLSYHWGLITREVFLSVWIVCFALIGFYLLGKLKFAHDSDLPFISVPRVVFAILSFVFVVYMIPGLWGAPVKMLSGILPPSFYSENKEIFAGGGSTMTTKDSLPDGVDPSHCPHNLNCFHDYDLALAYAKKVGKPLFVDFTGNNCANCRKNEDNLWPKPDVIKHLRNDYVVVSLYGDDMEELPKNKQYTTKDDVEIITYGNRWSQMQIDRYNSNAQPLYALLDNNEKDLVTPQGGLISDDKSFATFLETGMAEFQKRKK